MDGSTVEQSQKPKFDTLEERMTRTYGQIGLIKPDGTIGSMREYAAGLNIGEDHPRYNEIRMALEQSAEFVRMFGVLDRLQKSGRLSLEDAGGLKRPEPGGNIMPSVSTNLFHQYAQEINNMPDEALKFNIADFAGVFADQLKGYGLENVASDVIKQANPSTVSPSENGSSPA